MSLVSDSTLHLLALCEPTQYPALQAQLNQAADGVTTESVGDIYALAARMSSASGQVDGLLISADSLSPSLLATLGTIARHRPLPLWLLGPKRSNALVEKAQQLGARWVADGLEKRNESRSAVSEEAPPTPDFKADLTLDRAPATISGIRVKTGAASNGDAPTNGLTNGSTKGSTKVAKNISQAALSSVKIADGTKENKGSSEVPFDGDQPLLTDDELRALLGP